MDSLELARQWTLADHKLFLDISPNDLLSCSWGEPRHTLSSSNIRRFIDRFNSVSNWVTSSIVTGETSIKRAETYEFIIKLGQHFRNLHNFHGLMAILTGIQRGCITRMKETLSMVKSNILPIRKQLLADMEGSKNYSVYRKILHKFLRLRAHLKFSLQLKYSNWFLFIKQSINDVLS